MSNKEVYHGSSEKRTKSSPSRHKRIKKQQIIFDQVSFHASPEYWIALAYTYTPVPFDFEGQQVYYNVEIDLYQNKREVIIHGVNSLEESLQAIYGKGGYVSSFSGNDFFRVEGLGDLECITDKVLKAKKIEYIIDPIQKMKELNIRFKFLDLSKGENFNRRNFK